jgi:hypothetical protein
LRRNDANAAYTSAEPDRGGTGSHAARRRLCGTTGTAYDDGEVRQEFNICLAATVAGELQVSSESTDR